MTAAASRTYRAAVCTVSVLEEAVPTVKLRKVKA